MFFHWSRKEALPVQNRVILFHMCSVILTERYSVIKTNLLDMVPEAKRKPHTISLNNKILNGFKRQKEILEGAGYCTILTMRMISQIFLHMSTFIKLYTLYVCSFSLLYATDTSVKLLKWFISLKSFCGRYILNANLNG